MYPTPDTTVGGKEISMDQSIEGIRTTLGPKSVGILQKAWWHRFFSFDSSSSEADYAGILWNDDVVSLKIINL